MRVADVWDAENLDIVSVKMTPTCEVNASDWIRLSEDSLSKISLVLKPPFELKDDSCQVELKVSDNNPT